jgi:hypothetical protein
MTFIVKGRECSNIIWSLVINFYSDGFCPPTPRKCSTVRSEIVVCCQCRRAFLMKMSSWWDWGKWKTRVDDDDDDDDEQQQQENEPLSCLSQCYCPLSVHKKWWLLLLLLQVYLLFEMWYFDHHRSCRRRDRLMMTICPSALQRWCSWTESSSSVIPSACWRCRMVAVIALLILLYHSKISRNLESCWRLSWAVLWCFNNSNDLENY